jgi:putative transposase
VVQSQAFTDIISMQLIFDCAPKQRNLLQHLTLLINLTGALAIRSEQFQGVLGSVDSKDSLLGANQIQGCFWEAVLGVLERLVLSDAAWERMAPLIIGRPDQKGSTGRDNRMFVEGVLWIVRTGSPWRDLPEAFGDWNSVFRRFSRWSIKGVWWRIFEAMSDDPDFEYLIVDSTIVRAHQHAAGAKKGGLKIRRSAARAVA